MILASITPPPQKKKKKEKKNPLHQAVVNQTFVSHIGVVENISNFVREVKMKSRRTRVVLVRDTSNKPLHQCN